METFCTEMSKNIIYITVIKENNFQKAIMGKTIGKCSQWGAYSSLYMKFVLTLSLDYLINTFYIFVMLSVSQSPPKHVTGV